MRKLISLIVSLLALAAAIYLITMVPMGDKTLWQHLRSIAGTDESKQMVEGVKKTAQDVIERATKKDEPKKKAKDDLSHEDRKRLRKLLKKLDKEEEPKVREGKKKTLKEAEADKE